MAAMQRGDERALETLLDRYRARLFAFLTRRVGDPAAAEDLFQETWLRAVRARARFDPRRRFSTWLFQIANNLCRDRFRRVRVERRQRETMQSEIRSSAGGPAAARLENQLDMRQRVGALPDPLREVLVLRYYHDLSEAQMAEMLGVPRGTVKSRLHAAVGALRRQWGVEDVA